LNTLPVIQRQEFFSSFSPYCEQSIAAKTTLGLLLIDVVNLAYINHSYSYAHGDDALGLCFTQLQSISRLPDTIFRIGDRQFVFILPMLKAPAFAALAVNKVAKLLKGETTIRGDSVDIDVKIGVGLNKSAQFGAEDTLLVAENSLKKTKASKALFTILSTEKEEYQPQVFEKIFNEKLKANDFELYYQPKVDMQTGAVNRAEALLRWQVPGEGFVSPEIAVDIAEKTGQSFALTKWVIYTAVRQLKEWEKCGLWLNVAVNIPANLIQTPELFILVKDALAIWGVEKDKLTLEITESAIIDDKEAGFDNLSKLKEFGVSLSIDDFGTGYSSLSYFKHIPANELKIDKSFVAGLLVNTQDQEIVKIIIGIARLFDLKLVAEGIEDQATYDFLQRLGVDYGQGFHMAKPMPVKEFYQFMQARVIGKHGN